MTHYPGHLRDTFARAFAAFIETGGDPDANVMHEVKYEETTITLRKAAGLMMHCTDTLPGDLYDTLEEAFGRAFRPTYAGAAFAILKALRGQEETKKEKEVLTMYTLEIDGRPIAVYSGSDEDEAHTLFNGEVFKSDLVALTDVADGGEFFIRRAFPEEIAVLERSFAHAVRDGSADKDDEDDWLTYLLPVHDV